MSLLNDPIGVLLNWRSRHLPRWALIVLVLSGVCLATYLFLLATSNSANPTIVTAAIIGMEGHYYDRDPYVPGVYSSSSSEDAWRYFWTEDECFEVSAPYLSHRQAIRGALEAGRTCRLKVVGWNLPILGFRRRIVAVFSCQ